MGCCCHNANMHPQPQPGGSIQYWNAGYHQSAQLDLQERMLEQQIWHDLGQPTPHYVFGKGVVAYKSDDHIALQYLNQEPNPFEWINKPSYQAQPNPGKTRTNDKYRVVYTEKQRTALEQEFCFSRYITIRRKSELAKILGLSERQVKIWFQNRRAKDRKQIKRCGNLIMH